MSFEYPLVSAIMPTRGRPAFARCAVDCFKAQTWPNKELVIVDDRDDPSFPFGCPEAIYEALAMRRPIGAKRNLACSVASGEIIIHFDDDDYSGPQRIEDQVRRLLISGKPVTGYRTMVFMDETGSRGWQYVGASDYAIGTSLCYLRSYWQTNPFKELNTSEDNEFVYAAIRSGNLSTADADSLMYATIHPGNTSKRDLTTYSYREFTCA